MRKSLHRSLQETMLLEQNKQSRYVNAPTQDRIIQEVTNAFHRVWNDGQYGEKFLLTNISVTHRFDYNSWDFFIRLLEKQDGAKQPIEHSIVWHDPHLCTQARLSVLSTEFSDIIFYGLLSYLEEKVCEILRSRRKAPKPTRNKRYNTVSYKPKSNRRRITQKKR